MSVAVAGAGAFGTALAITISANGPLTLWSRDPMAAAEMRRTRRNTRYLPEIDLPADVAVSAELEPLLAAETILLAMPAQSLRGFLRDHRRALVGKHLVACSKGIDLASMTGTATSIAEEVPGATAAILTGPSFAADIACGLPTAVTLACADAEAGEALQMSLSTRVLRLYRSTDVVGAELGGALKNVMAIACGACIGGGYGESARAALMTRGFAEMQRFAGHFGARPETLMGLSGLGDLALTCTSELSRNYRYGLARARREDFDPETTVEGAKTAEAVAKLAWRHGIDMPISRLVADVIGERLDIEAALSVLLSRPLKEE